MKYVDADKLIAAIEMRLKNTRDYINGAGMKYKGPKFYKGKGKESAYDELLSIIYFLQQEQPEVDLDREIIKYKVPFADDREVLNETTLDAIARHFYELGLKAKK